MTKTRTKSEEIRLFILEHVDKHPSDIANIAVKKYGISRQAINKHLKKLSAEHSLIEQGNTRNKTYKLAPIKEWEQCYVITPELAEDIIWRKDILPIFRKMPDNVIEIWHYGFTEMFNNALDHSESDTILVQITQTAVTTKMVIRDSGVGVFKKIKNSLNLLDERHALLELSKGKLTTDPARHSGEGIFFTSRMFDDYLISSEGVFFSHLVNESEDWIGETDSCIHGTSVSMILNNHTARSTKKIFDQFTTGDNYGFNKTVVPVKLAQYGNDKLISRSQAKRLLARIEVFKIVVFDFKEVESIGQAFADEIFRVFANEHPNMELISIRENKEVKNMISRAKQG